jgi:hypothetical protein
VGKWLLRQHPFYQKRQGVSCFFSLFFLSQSRFLGEPVAKIKSGTYEKASDPFLHPLTSDQGVLAKGRILVIRIEKHLLLRYVTHCKNLETSVREFFSYLKNDFRDYPKRAH